MIAWHFVGATLRNGVPIPADGEWLTFNGEVRMCESGLHASRDPYDALQCAPNTTLCMVECEDIVAEARDKLVCRRRKIIKRIDATGLIWAFARKCALDVIHLWDAPQVVRDYLVTGDESLRAEARNAATATRTNAAWDAEGAAARAAARNAAWAAEGAAALAAVRNAALAAEMAATQNAMWAAARNATRNAMWAKARNAALAVEMAATRANTTWAAARNEMWAEARAAALAAARDLENQKQREHFKQLVDDVFSQQ